MHPICEKCCLYSHCQKPVIKGKGVIEPKLILVLSSPPLGQDQTGEIEIPSLMGLNESEVYITYAVKCCAFKDPITKYDGLRQASAQEIEYCKTFLLQELAIFEPSIPIITFGKVALQSLFPENDGITKEVGKVKQFTVGNKIFNVLPNYHPDLIASKPGYFATFKQVIRKAYKRQFEDDSSQERVKLLDYPAAISYLKNLLALYTEGEIDYVVFDIESTSLLPFKGKSIMYSFATENEVTAYSIPLVINNNFVRVNTLNALKIESQFKKQMDDLESQIGILLEEIGKLEDPEGKVNPLLQEKKEAIHEKRKVLKEIAKQADQELEGKFQEIVKQYTIPFEITPAQAAQIDALVVEILETIPLIGQNLKFDLMFKMIESGVDIYKCRIQGDTQIMGHIVNGPKNLSLKDQARAIFDVKDDWDERVKLYLTKFQLIVDKENYGNMPTGLLGEYAALDAYWTKRLYKNHLEEIPVEQFDILEEVTRATIPFAECEGKGIHLDQNYYQFIQGSFGNAVGEYLNQIRELPTIKELMEKELIEIRAKNASPRKKVKWTEDEMLSMAFNVGSNADIKKIIYEKFKFPIKEDFMTDGGKSGVKQPQTNDIALNYFLSIAQEGTEAKQFIQSLLKYKEIITLKNRLDNIPSNTYDELYKTKFMLTSTKTGRLSSDFHSIPSKSDFKRIFSSRWMNEGGLFLAADQSQLEVRVGASICNETSMIEAYSTGIDVHTQTAADIFKIPLEEVSGKQRGIAKTINFGILYGKTAYSLHKELKVTKEEAQEFIDKWFATKPAIAKWIPLQIESVRKCGYVLTAMGRIIYIPDINSREFKKRKHAENQAINTPIQSPASDIGVRAGNEIAYGLKRDKKRSLFLASVHDSLEYDVYPGELFYVMKQVKYECETNVRKKYDWIKCPLQMDISLGTSWGGALELDIQELNDGYLKATSKGLKKDFILLHTVAKRAYDIQINVLKVSEPDAFPIDVVVRDDEQWKAEIIISQR